MGNKTLDISYLLVNLSTKPTGEQLFLTKASKQWLFYVAVGCQNVKFECIFSLDIRSKQLHAKIGAENSALIVAFLLDNVSKSNVRHFNLQ